MRVTEYVRSTRTILFLAVSLRLIFSPITGHPYDLPIWMESGKLLASGVSPYSPVDHLGQTILWAIWTGICYIISGIIPFGSPWIYIFLIKLLPNICDFVSVFLILDILEDELGEFNPNELKRYIGIMTLNPVLIFASSFWGMADSLALVCILMAYKNITSNRIFLSSTWMTASIALKLYPVVLVPVFLLYLMIYDKRIDHAVFYSIWTVTLFLLIAYVPFLFLPWSSFEMTGVLSSQTARAFGGISPLGIFTIAGESSYIGHIFNPIGSQLGKIYVIRFFWLINSIMLSIMMIFFRYRQKISLPEDKFLGFFSLLVIYYCIWILCASWVSEQNFVPLLLIGTMLYVYLEKIGANKYSLDEVLYFQTGTVTGHIILNVPVILFFYKLNSKFFMIYENQLFMELRSISLSILILVTMGTLIKLLVIQSKIILQSKEIDGTIYEGID